MAINITGAGTTLTMNSTLDADSITIPAPTTPGWTYTVNGTGITDAPSGSNGRWGSGGANKVLSGVGNWTMTGTYNGGSAACSYASPSVTYTVSKPSSSAITTNIDTSGGGF